MIVAIESASTDCSVALASPTGELAAVIGWSSDHRQGHELLPRLLELLAARRLGLTDVTVVAVGLGPGSFTGLRVGMSIAKGLAFARSLPIFGVASLDAWLASAPGTEAAVARAGAREAYLQHADASTLRIVGIDELTDAVEGRPVVAPTELAAAFGLRNARPPLEAAGAVARMAAERLGEDPEGDDLHRLEPRYERQPRGVGQLPHAEVVRWP